MSIKSSSPISGEVGDGITFFLGIRRVELWKASGLQIDSSISSVVCFDCFSKSTSDADGAGAFMESRAPVSLYS